MVRGRWAPPPAEGQGSREGQRQVAIDAASCRQQHNQVSCQTPYHHHSSDRPLSNCLAPSAPFGTILRVT